MGASRTKNRRTSSIGRRGLIAAVTMVVLGNVAVGASAIGQTGGSAQGRNPSQAQLRLAFETRKLDGSGNNQVHRDWGQAGTNYRRIGRATFADGIAAMVDGPNVRLVSNRIFNDIGQNLFSENDVSQWGWTWGQFLDHDMGLRDETPGEKAPITFNSSDPLEAFTNDLGALSFSRTPAAPNTGVTSPRQEVNTLSSYLDASNVYGVTRDRLEWLRDGAVNGDLADNAASLMLPGGFLPTVAERNDPATAPPVDLMGRLRGEPNKARVAGDVRANENIALTTTHTLFAREHNRIVGLLPSSLSDARKFSVARRIVGAEVQFITYNEFLPAMGVKLPRYRGYNSSVNVAISNEFAVVGYRAHSMIHGQFDVAFADGAYTPAQLDAFRAEGIGVGEEAGNAALNIPLTVAFGNPDLLPAVGFDAFLPSLSAERQYRNDEQIDNSLRSVLFKIPKPGTTDPSACQQPVVDPACFSAVEDLGAIDIARGRDHGVPSYNDMRRAFGLSAKRTFTGITGEKTDQFPVDPLIDAAKPIDDLNILDFTELRDRNGKVIDPAADTVQEEAVAGDRRSTVAARLKAMYGSVDKIDAFVGMVSEPHVRGTEFGPLQLAMWTKQFAALRDGDRFFYATDDVLPIIERAFGVSFKHTLAEIITMNSGATVPANVFKVAAT